MTYISKWEHLPDALDRVVEATGLSKEAAQADICRAVFDGVIEIRAGLGEHNTRPMRSGGTMLGGDAFQIPTPLNPEDFDWQRSRPIKPWFVRREAFRQPGYWNLKWIELSRADVTNVLCTVPAAGESSAQAQAKTTLKTRRRPTLERAQHAIQSVYPDGVPSQVVEPNATLYRHIGDWLKGNGLPNVSDDTILRAAGRRN